VVKGGSLPRRFANGAAFEAFQAWILEKSFDGPNWRKTAIRMSQ
jgi:hypothetical protein